MAGWWGEVVAQKAAQVCWCIWLRVSRMYNHEGALLLLMEMQLLQEAAHGWFRHTHLAQVRWPTGCPAFPDCILAVFQASSVLNLKNSCCFFLFFFSNFYFYNIFNRASLPVKLMFGFCWPKPSQQKEQACPCPTWLLRANQFGTIPEEMKVPKVDSSVVSDFCMNEVLQVHLVILTDLTNIIMEQSLSHGCGLHHKHRL